MKIFDYAALGGKFSWDYSRLGVTPESDGITPIADTNKSIEMGDVLVIDNIAYTVSSMSGKGDTYYAAYVKKLKNQEIFVGNNEPADQNYKSEITCPYCGCETESWEMDDEEDDYECGNCGSTFSYQRYVTVEYCSQPKYKAVAKRL